jgi:hypothetical protein
VCFTEVVTALDETKNGMAVEVIRVADTLNEDNMFQGKDMGPCCSALEQIGIQQVAAVIVETRDQIPFHLGVRSKFVMGRIVLNKFSSVMSQDFSVVRDPFFALLMMVGKETLS